MVRACVSHATTVDTTGCTAAWRQHCGSGVSDSRGERGGCIATWVAWDGHLKLDLESVALFYVHEEALVATGLQGQSSTRLQPMPMSAHPQHSQHTALRRK